MLTLASRNGANGENLESGTAMATGHPSILLSYILHELFRYNVINSDVLETWKSLLILVNFIIVDRLD